MLQYNPSISGSLSVTGSLIVTNGVIGTVSGVDVQIFSSSINQVITGIQTTTGSQDGRLTSIESFTSSTSARLSSIETISASNLSRLNSLEEKTGSLATTGSNTFIGTQTITGSLFISADLIVQGSSSLQNITASAVSIGTNIVNLNTANPAIRYAGLVIGDSGSIGSSGSFLYDSVQDEMIFVHRGANTTVTSSVVLMGPQTYDSIGSETYPTLNIIQKGTGNEHLVDSCIIDDGTTTCVKNNLITTGTACFGNTVTAASSLSIGGADQGYQLDVKRTSTGDSTFDTIANFYKASTNGTQLLIRAKNGLIDLAGSYVIGGGGPNTGLSFSVSPSAGTPTEAVRILNNGNVGINAVSPNVKFEVCGTGLFTDNSVYVGGCGGQLRVVKNANSTPATLTIFGYDNLSVNQAAGVIDFDLQLTGTCGHTAASIRALNADANESSAHLAFYTATNTGVTKAGAAGTERLRITCDGRIGIGTCNPGALLAVHGPSGANGFGFFMGGAGTTLGGIKMGNDVTTYGSLYFDNATNDVLLLQEYPLGNLRFGTNSSEKMRITNSGCVIVCNNTLPLATPSVFGYSSSYQVLILGNTNNGQTKSLAFGVDVSGNNSGAFSGYGNEYIWRCAGSFITPNSANNGYNTIFNWTNGGCSWFSNPLGIGTSSLYGGLTVSEFTANDSNDSIALFYKGTCGNHESLIKFYDFRGQVNASIGNNLHDDGPGTQKARLVFKTSNSGAPTERMRIWADGVVTFCCQICTPGISVTSNPIGVEYLVIAGGGGGGWDVGGGGGAGGVLNGSTGIWPGTYAIGIGAGGPGKSGGGGTSTSQNGYNTYAIGLMAIGGGGGGNYSAGNGSSGGSGGGGAGYGATTAAGFGMKGQGFEGGCGINVAGTASTGGGGGGAGGVGPSSVNNLAGSTTGGVGIISTIIGEHRSYGCGGRGGGDNWSGPMNTGTANTGNGGDGAGVPNEGCAGGSGIVILKMKNTNSATFSGGLTTYTCTNVACYNIYVVTAGAGTVTIS